MGKYVRSIHTVVFRVFAPTTCVTSPFTAKHRSNLKPPESDNFAWEVLANRFLPNFKPLGRGDSVYDSLATHSQVDFPAARECSCRVGLPRKPVSRPISSHADLEEGDDDIDDEDDDDDQDDDDDDVGNDGPFTRPSRNDGQGIFLGHGSVERGLEQRVGHRFAEV